MHGWVLAAPDPPAEGLGRWQHRGALRVLVILISGVLLQDVVIPLCVSSVPAVSLLLWLVVLSAVCSLGAKDGSRVRELGWCFQQHQLV